jgi:hypothetical protein
MRLLSMFTSRIAVLLTLGMMGLLVFAVGPAFAADGVPQWTVTSVARPTNFVPGLKSGEDGYQVTVTNTGGVSTNGSPVEVTDELPEGLTLATAGAKGENPLAGLSGFGSVGFNCELRTCTYSGIVIPDQTLVFTFHVDVAENPPASCEAPAGAVSCVENVVRVTGGGGNAASMRTATAISSEPAKFGFSSGGASTALSSTQAGAHPDITNDAAFDTVNGTGSTAGDFKDVTYSLPPGFSSDFVGTPTCASGQFLLEECPVDTQIGVTTITFAETGGLKGAQIRPVFNLVPNAGEIAKLGFPILPGNIQIKGGITLRPGDYGANVTFRNTNQVATEVDGISLTVWGVPADPIHNQLRWKSEGGSIGKFGASSEVALVPFFTNPTSCGAGQLESSFTVNSWQEPEHYVQEKMEYGPMVGCDRLDMEPLLTAEATTNKASASSGLDLNVGIPQTYDNAEGLATPTLEKQVVTLPEGMTVNPSAGAGLAACTPEEYAQEGVEYVEGQGCPKESKLGEVEIITPSLSEHAKGSVFLAEPAPFGESGHNPFNSLLALYIVARIQDRGVLVKAAGQVQANPLTGQLVTTFDTSNAEAHNGLPPLPFSQFTFRFNQGAGAPLVTPPACGLYTVTAELTPYSDPEGLPITPPIAPFPISSSFDGGACPSGGIPPFKPQVVSGTENNDAGSYSPFYLRIVREDGEQEITKFTSVFPPGLTGNLTGIPFCPEADIEAARGVTGTQELEHASCPAASEIGHTLVGAGVGSVLAQAPGKIYLAGPYHGSALSVVSITAAKVGPFDLGTVVIRFALSINPITAQVEINGANSDPIPHIIKGIVVHVRDIRAYINREKFIVNPTTCNRSSISETITGAGANPADPADQMTVAASAPFQAADCSNLKFKPTFKVSTSGKTSRTRGASLTAKLSFASGGLGSEANFKSVKVDLPKQLPSRLTTLQKACLDTTFEANPAACPTDSKVGEAKAITPILPVPLEGPAYFVSYGGAKFPELVIVLQGYGFTIDLHGETFISKAGITSSTFHAVPDEPVTSFELTLPEGPYSALAANGNLCTIKLAMPTAFTAQNGDTIHQSTPINVTGCPKHKTTKHKTKKGKKKAARGSVRLTVDPLGGFS